MGNSIRRAGGYRIVLADAFNFVKESYEALSAMAEVVRARKAPPDEAPDKAPGEKSKRESKSLICVFELRGFIRFFTRGFIRGVNPH